MAALRRGEVIVFPTETLYGLGADALNGTAVEKVFQLKGRDSNNPIPVLVSDQVMLRALVTQISHLAEILIDAFWPGPMTLVLPARHEIPRALLNSNGGVGVRISSQPIAARLVESLGRPLTATSANPSGQEPARTIAQAKSYFAKELQHFIDGGTLTSQHGSTVVEIQAKQVKIIRPGEITGRQLERVLGAERVAQ
jgi:L-threonylcarbamoyladenylate synthase